MKLQEVSNDIKNRTKVLVTGEVDYSHIASKIDGDELKRANEYTNYPSKDPYFKMTIRITEQDYTKAFDYNANDKSELTLAAYLGSKVYQSKKEENQGKNYFSAISKGNEVRVFKKGEDGLLKKQPIQVGLITTDATEVKGGISKGDYIAFPYGADCVEGAKTEDSTYEQLYGY